MSRPESTSCPSMEDLIAFSRGDLTGSEQSRLITQHLSSCDNCLERLQALTTHRIRPGDSGKGPAGGLPIGSMLGTYRLLEPIGGGGMGVVYKALHSKLRQVVALKTMTRSALLDPQAVARFQREMAALGVLIHPNIVRATDAGEWEGWHFLVMEYVEGIDLNQLVKVCGPLSVADACEVVRQAAAGLQFIHEHQRVHRDLKPSNLMLTVTGQVKILDLGLALLNEIQADEELTGSHQVMGTADYMAPEQARNSHQVDIRADLYSLGCTLFKLLTGMAPYSQVGDLKGQKLRAHAELPVPPLSAIRPDVPELLEQIVQELLAKEPEDRYQEPAAVVADLSTFAQGSELTELARSAMEKRVHRAAKDAGVLHQKETIPFRQPTWGEPAVKSTPTPTYPEPPPPPAATVVKPRKRLAIALGVFVVLVVSIWAAWARLSREEPLSWPADYPEVLKKIPTGETVALIDKRPWRPEDPLDKIRGGTRQYDMTLQPLWRRRILGQGVYYEANPDLQFYAKDPTSVSFLELSHDRRRPWFELEIELMSLEAKAWVGGIYVGWHERKPGLAETYLLFLERGAVENRLHLAPVAVHWKKEAEPSPVYPFEPLDEEEIITLRAPKVHLFNRVKLRATRGKLAVEVEGGQSATIVAALDTRGSLGLWVQKGFAYCGRILYTPLHTSPAE